MHRAYVLMTAMPPTKGHQHLIQYARQLADRVTVILCTQPDEPYFRERHAALFEAFKYDQNVAFKLIHRQMEQNPEADGFWEMWRKIMVEECGVCNLDTVVASEPYGQAVAAICGAKFMPYDIDRDIYNCKATWVRNDPQRLFSAMIPEFQRYIRQTVTIFGAESTGKTTLSRELADRMNGHWLFEWARPYLETVGIDITETAMRDIWQGQLALQKHGRLDLVDKPWLVQDTDLYSTVGYWDLWGKELSPTPCGLEMCAAAYKSDLYLITQSNIPFEADPIRYGGDKRESDDQFWIDLCVKYNLNYYVLQSKTLIDRIIEGKNAMQEHWDKNVNLEYDRHGF